MTLVEISKKEMKLHPLARSAKEFELRKNGARDSNV